MSTPFQDAVQPGDKEARRLRYCPRCGGQIRREARFCDQCGYNLAGPSTARRVRVDYQPVQPQQPSAPVTSHASPLVAAILALGPGFFGLMGLGHIYVRSLAKGLVLLVVGAVLGLFTWVLIFGLLLSPTSFAGGDLDTTGLIGATLLFALIFFPLWLWEAYDAYSIAKKMQPSSEMTMPPPYY